MIIKWLSLLIFFNCIVLYAGDSALLTDISVQQKNDKISIEFQFDKKVKYHCMSLQDPERLVLDLNDVILKTSLSNLTHSLFERVRTSDHQHEYLRLVFDLKEKVTFKTSYSSVDNSLTLKLLLDGKKSLEKPSMNSLSPEPVLKLVEKEKNKKIIIVIDPGHGGKDPGAAGLHGALEKNVVLQIAKQLQVLLNNESGFSAILTRSTDCYLPLRQRLAIARKNHADMFVAIHADAYHQPHATGASVYALSQRGATSEAARWLAEKENESELGGLSEELADKDAILRSVLIDLSQTRTIECSLQIGNTLLRHLGKFARLHHSSVEQAAFVVLKSPDIPSVLVETGFLSNPSEEEKLIDSTYQHQTAYSIKEGIKQYFINNPPIGAWSTAKQHVNHLE